MACRDCEHFEPSGWGGRDNWIESHCKWRPDWPTWLVEALQLDRKCGTYEGGGWKCPAFKERPHA